MTKSEGGRSKAPQQNLPQARHPKTGEDAKISVFIEKIHKRMQVRTSFQNDGGLRYPA